MTEQKTVVFDPSALTFGDLKTFEKVTGIPYSDAFAERNVVGPGGAPVLDERGKPVKTSEPTMDVQVTLVWLFLRKDNPALTLEEVEDMPIGSINFATESQGEVPSSES